MPRLILKSPYMKPGKGSLQRYVKYIATREGVELPEEPTDKDPATENQIKMVREMIKQYPDAKEMPEYSDYRAAPTKVHARKLILALADEHPELFRSRGGYISYMANRPGVEKIDRHGLFSSSDRQPDIEAVQKELEEYTGNVWTHIISLRREDAERLGYNTPKA